MTDELKEILASCIEGIEAEGWSVEECLTKYQRYRTELEPMLQVAMNLRSARLLRASDAFRRQASARMQLRLQASQRPPQGKLVSDSTAPRSRLGNWIPARMRSLPVIPTIVALVLGLVISMGAMVTAADAAGPGDLLFGLDLAVEELRLRFTKDEATEAELRLEFATERISEAEFELEIEGDIQDIEAALAAFDEAIAGLQPLLDRLTPEQQAAIQEAIDSLNTVRGYIVRLEIEIEDGELELELEREAEDDEEDDALNDGDDDLEDDHDDPEDDEGDEGCGSDEEDDAEDGDDDGGGKDADDNEDGDDDGDGKDADDDEDGDDDSDGKDSDDDEDDCGEDEDDEDNDGDDDDEDDDGDDD